MARMVIVRADHVVVIAYGAADSQDLRGAERMRTERGLSVGMLLTAGIRPSIHKRDVGGSGFSGRVLPLNDSSFRVHRKIIDRLLNIADTALGHITSRSPSEHVLHALDAAFAHSRQLDSVSLSTTSHRDMDRSSPKKQGVHAP